MNAREEMLVEEAKATIECCNDGELRDWYSFLLMKCRSAMEAEIIVLIRKELRRRELFYASTT